MKLHYSIEKFEIIFSEKSENCKSVFQNAEVRFSLWDGIMSEGGRERASLQVL